VLLIRQAAPGEKPFWALPGGVVEDGELVVEGLAREVLEETGLTIVPPLRLAFLVQIDNRRPEQLHASRGPGTGYLATVWTLESEWRGELVPADPDGFVVEAEFVPLAHAIERLERTRWLGWTASYLRGDLEAGSAVFERWDADGSVQTVASVRS
jgi:ADP-ribose pyrophosphatase YjhB (NUDIX family)